MSEITYKWNGTAINGAHSGAGTWTVRDLALPDVAFDPGGKLVQALDGIVVTTDPVPEPGMVATLAVTSDTSGVTGSTAERRNTDAWPVLNDFFNPLDGVVKLESTRKDGSGADVVRHLWVQAITAPPYQARTGAPEGLRRSGAYGDASASHIVYVFQMRLVFPYWQRSTLLDQDTSPATAKLDIDSGTPDTITVNNPGVRWVGIRAVAANVSGSVTGWRITNTTNGDVLQVNDAGFANSDVFDWFATDPLARTIQSGHTIQLGSGMLRLEPGDNALEGVRASGSGTMDLNLSWPALYFTQ